MKRLIALLLAGACHAPLHAGSLSDTWWIASQPGRGFTVAHDGDVLALGVFEHDAQGRPHWYNALLRRDASAAPGEAGFSGTLMETALVDGVRGSRAVGPIAFRPLPDGRAEIEYRTDAGPQRHLVERFTVTMQDPLEGLHFATLLPGYENCTPGFTGLRVFERGTLYVERCEGAQCLEDPPPPTRNREVVHMNLMNGTERICAIEGRFRRYGNSGAITGSYECADGGHGPIAMQDIEFTDTGFSARFRAGHPQCGAFRGILSGIRAGAR